MIRWRRFAWTDIEDELRVILGILAGVAVAVAVTAAPQIAAGGLLYPARRTSIVTTPPACVDRAFDGEGVTLHGWLCRASAPRRGTLVYLHGIADNRSSSVGAVERFTVRGLDVIAYDSRAHGASGGDACTYGYLEKRDLIRVITSAAPGPVVLMGASLGGAVALQAAALDNRISAVIAAEVFSDLRTVARERAPWFLPPPIVRKAFQLAEQRGGFLVDAVNVIDAARSVRVPVLLIHGALDSDTTPDHSRRVRDALAGPRRLIEVPGAGHNQSLSDRGTWTELERWIDSTIRGATRRESSGPT